MNTDRPLDGIRSIKAKLGLLVGVSVCVAALVSEIGDRSGVSVWLTLPVTVAAALAVTQWLARGMTSPLREMTAAASAMATGDRSRRVTATSSDEVGQLATAFNTMASDLAAADRQRRQLVATVSHELRTPLAAQQALLENLVDGVVSPDDAVLRTALAQAERLGSLVADLLDLARVDGGRVPLSLTPVRVADIVRAAVAEASVSVSGRTHRHEVSVDESLVVTADAGRLAQVLANLLDNADRHGPAGGRVTVSAGVEKPGGPDAHDARYWWLEVADEGPGIDPAQTERVFDRFGSGDDSGGGTGIGLAIASWVCELHGGSISVLPPDDGRGGARLRAVLPREPGPPASGPVEPPTPAPHLSHHSPPHRPPHQEAPVSTPSSAPVAAPRPFLDSVFGDLWPEAGLTAQARVLLACLGVGALAAVLLPDARVGLSSTLLLLLGGALVWRLHRRSGRPVDRWTLVCAGLCAALALVPIVRAAEWLTVLALMLGVVLTTTALTRARGIVSLVAGAAAWPLSAVRGLPLLGRTISATSRVAVLWPVVRTVAISLVVLLVFGGLFASGDAVFGSWAQNLVPHLAVDGFVQRAFVGFVVGGSLLAVCYLALNPPKVGSLTVPAGRPVSRPWEWAVPVGLVVVLFAGFVAAQATALFGGHDYVRRSTGLTYAEYVHEGFGQLTVATLLTLAVIALAVRRAPTGTPGERLLLRGLLGALCVLTLLVVASALHRIDLYQQSYGFTVLRLLAAAAEVWLGLLVVLVLIAGVRLSGWWLPRAALVSAAAFVLAATVVNPEAWVAQRNVDRYQATGVLDPYYLRSLGADAEPTVVANLPVDVSACVYAARPAADPGVLDWNLGRAQAAVARPAGAAAPAAATCTATLDRLAGPSTR